MLALTFALLLVFALGAVTVPGGRYKRPDGSFVDANGRKIDAPIGDDADPGTPDPDAPIGDDAPARSALEAAGFKTARDVRAYVDGGNDLVDLDGVGPKTAPKIAEYFGF